MKKIFFFAFLFLSSSLLFAQWDALGRGAKSGVEAYQRGQELQVLRRATDQTFLIRQLQAENDMLRMELYKKEQECKQSSYNLQSLQSELDQTQKAFTGVLKILNDYALQSYNAYAYYDPLREIAVPSYHKESDKDGSIIYIPFTDEERFAEYLRQSDEWETQNQNQ